MKISLLSLLIIALTYPALASAQDSHQRFVSEDRVITISNTGSVSSHTSASASSGGQTAAAGQSVTDGDVSASSHVETHINTDDSGGTVQVKVETSKNGTTDIKEYTKSLEKGEPVKVNVSAESSSKGSRTETTVNGVDLEGSSASSTVTREESHTIDTRGETKTRIQKTFRAIPTFFRKAFSFLWSWY